VRRELREVSRKRAWDWILRVSVLLALYHLPKTKNNDEKQSNRELILLLS
jgi:hypothetical protein